MITPDMWRHVNARSEQVCVFNSLFWPKSPDISQIMLVDLSGSLRFLCVPVLSLFISEAAACLTPINYAVSF